MNIQKESTAMPSTTFDTGISTRPSYDATQHNRVFTPTNHTSNILGIYFLDPALLFPFPAFIFFDGGG